MVEIKCPQKCPPLQSYPVINGIKPELGALSDKSYFIKILIFLDSAFLKIYLFLLAKLA